MLNISFYFFLIFTFIPYVGLSIIPSDVQPLSCLAAIIFLTLTAKSYEISIRKDLLIILLIPSFLSITSLIYCNSGLFYPLKQFFGYFSGLLILCASFVGFKYKREQLFFFIKRIFPPLILILCFISSISIFREILSPFISARGVGYSGRGISTFAAEPSYVSSWLLIIYLIEYSLKKVNNNWVNFKNNNLSPLCYLIPSVLSRSGQILVIISIFILAFLINLIYINLKSLRKLKLKIFKINFTLKNIFLLSLVISFTNLIISSNLLGRVYQTLNAILLYGFQYPYLDENAIIRTSSFLYQIGVLIYRPFDLCVAKLYSAKNVPEGIIALNPIGDFVTSIQNTIFSTPEGLRFIPKNLYSILGNYIVDFGLVGLFLLILFYILILIPFIKNYGLNTMNIIILMVPFLNISLAFPPFWFLIGLIYAINYFNIRNKLVS